jgi:hypothetical protein
MTAGMRAAFGSYTRNLLGGHAARNENGRCSSFDLRREVHARGHRLSSFRAKTGKAQTEHIFSGLPPKADIQKASSAARAMCVFMALTPSDFPAASIFWRSFCRAGEASSRSVAVSTGGPQRAETRRRVWGTTGQLLTFFKSLCQQSLRDGSRRPHQ